jgi:ornithine cyclodeaminase
VTGTSPLLFLSRADVIATGGADIVAAMGDVAAALASVRSGTAEMPPETSVRLGDAGTGQARAYALSARTETAAGVKWTAHRPSARDGAPSTLSMTLVNDALTGQPRGLVESGLLTAVRTAAVSALVLRRAAPCTLRSVTLLGAGSQARTHLRMLAAVLPGLESVTVWNRTSSGGDAMVAEARPHAPWPLHCVPDLAAALANADAVITCTNAAAPFLGAEVMRPGRLLMQIGYHEVSFDAIDRADAVIVDQWGEFRLTSAKTLFQMHRAGRFPATRVSADLADVVLGGWAPAAGEAVYFSSFGLNVFDIALADRVLDRAQRDGIGTQLSLSGDAAGAWPLS